MKKNKIISNWLYTKGDLEIERLVRRNLAIASKVRKMTAINYLIIGSIITITSLFWLLNYELLLLIQFIIGIGFMLYSIKKLN